MKKFSKYLKFVLIGFMSLFMVLGLAGCGQKDSLGKIQSAKTLKVGMLGANPPYSFHKEVNGKDKLVGSDVMLSHKIANAMHVKLKIKTMNPDGVLPALQSGKVNMLVTSMAPTKQRKQHGTFSTVYGKARDAISVRKSDLSKYNNNHALLKKATIAVVGGSTQAKVLEKKFPKAHFKDFSSMPDTALAVKEGKADAFSVDVPTTEILLNRNKGLRQTNYTYTDSSLGGAAMMPKHTSKKFRKLVNKVIAENRTYYSKYRDREAKSVKNNK